LFKSAFVLRHIVLAVDPLLARPLPSFFFPIVKGFFNLNLNLEELLVIDGVFLRVSEVRGEIDEHALGVVEDVDLLGIGLNPEAVGVLSKEV
jgi:hypothetical protein